MGQFSVYDKFNSATNLAGFTIGNADTTNLSSSGAGYAVIHPSLYSDPITHIGIAVNSVVGSPPLYKVTLQGITSSGTPDGVDVGGGSPTATNFQPSGSNWNNRVKWIELTNPYTPYRGELLCAAVEYSSGSVDGSNYISITRSFDSQFNGVASPILPYALTKSAGSWAKSNGGNIGFKTSNKTFGYCIGNTNANNVIFTTGHRQAKSFVIGSDILPSGSTYNVIGFHCAVFHQIETVATTKFGIWDESGSVLSQTIIDFSKTGSSLNSSKPYTIIFSGVLPDLNVGQKYYAGVEVQSASHYWPGLYYQRVENGDTGYSIDIGANGENISFASWNGSSWTEDRTKIPALELIIDNISMPNTGGTANYYFVGRR